MIKDSLLTYLLVSVPSILTLTYQVIQSDLEVTIRLWKLPGTQIPTQMNNDRNPWLTFHEILIGSKRSYEILVLAYHNPDKTGKYM